MENSPFAKPSKKGIILPIIFYILAVALLITAIVSLVACHQNIAMQLEQGVPVKGNELAIVNLYLTSCAQYFALAAVVTFCGIRLRRLLMTKADMAGTNLLCASNDPFDTEDTSDSQPIDSEEDDDCDLEALGFRERVTSEEDARVDNV